MYAAPGAHLVTGMNEPVFLVDDQYWLWQSDRWLVWRDIGWRTTSSPPPVLQDLDGRMSQRTLFITEP